MPSYSPQLSFRLEHQRGRISAGSISSQILDIWDMTGAQTAGARSYTSRSSLSSPWRILALTQK